MKPREGDEARRGLPSVDQILRSPDIAELRSSFSHDVVARLIRRVLQSHRDEVASGSPRLEKADLVNRIVAIARSEWTVGPRPVINATGVILHTNLGRAPLSSDALSAISDASLYSDLEMDLTSGKRESRQEGVGGLLRAITGVGAAHVTVNNAGAVTLALAALGRGKDILVSRGQSVEIGGGFRIPGIIRQSGARLVEVGTTNRTTAADYADAITSRTAAILHVHTSNFKIMGFTEEASMGELSEVARSRGIILVDDNGSGALLDTATYGLAHEPMPAESLAAGADIVAFSGDKLLGGPQSGILLGPTSLMEKISRHPLARAMRPDKLSLAGLSATLIAYLRGDAHTTVPVWQMIAERPDDIHCNAEEWQRAAMHRGLHVELADGLSTVGGGSLPGETLPTTVIVLPQAIRASALRQANPAVVARTRGDRVHLDLRTVPSGQRASLLDVVCSVADAV